jgi:hypothetical protein
LGTSDTDLSTLLAAQLELQVNSYGEANDSLQRQYGDPRLLEGEDRADFIIWNHTALIRELGEMLEEVQWKPWVTDGSRGEWIDRDAYVKEGVDAFHFFMNLLLVAAAPPDGYGGVQTSEELAEEFVRRYFVKRATNARRQHNGYDGKKDANKRELDDVERPR